MLLCDNEDDYDSDVYGDNDNLRLAGVHVFEEEEPNWFPSEELREDQDIGIHKVITLKHNNEIMLNDENLLIFTRPKPGQKRHFLQVQKVLGANKLILKGTSSNWGTAQGPIPMVKGVSS